MGLVHAQAASSTPDGKKSYQRQYGAWVCRQWEREHGQLPQHVQFVKRWTKVPHPQEARRMGWGWDPWELPSIG